MDRCLTAPAGCPIGDGKWLVLRRMPAACTGWNNRCGKLVARKLAPALHVPSTSLEVRFTADRAEYLEATGGH